MLLHYTYHPPAHIAGGINVFRMTELPLSLPQSASLTAPSSDGAYFFLRYNTRLTPTEHPASRDVAGGQGRPPLRWELMFCFYETFCIPQRFGTTRRSFPTIRNNVLLLRNVSWEFTLHGHPRTGVPTVYREMVRCKFTL